MAIALHLVSAVTVEFAHHEGHATGSSRGPIFASHDCGANERHLPIDGNRACAVCVNACSARAMFDPGPGASELPVASAVRLAQSARLALSPDLFHSGQRGPPAA